MSDAQTDWFRTLLTEDLSGVHFARDHIELQFNPPPSIEVYGAMTVTREGRTVQRGAREFANALIAQVNKLVSDVSVERGAAVLIDFEDGSRISFSLRREPGRPCAFRLDADGMVREG